MSVVGDRFIARISRTLSAGSRCFRSRQVRPRRRLLPGIGTALGFGGKRTDRETFYTFSSITTPPSMYHYDILSGASRSVAGPR